MQRFFMVVGLTILLVASSGCSSSSTSPPPSGAAHNLYVTDFAKPGHIAIVPLPISGGSVPTSIVAPAGLQNVTELAFDASGNLWAVDDFTTAAVTGYSLPITNSSAPFATINIPGALNPDALTFDKTGNLWVADAGTNKVYEFVGPFSGSITPAPAVTISSVTAPAGLAFDTAGNLYVSSAIFGSGTIQIFNPPFSTGQLPTGSPLTGPQQPEGLAFDAAGNLYTANFSNGAIDRFNAPTAGGGPISIHAAGTETLIISGQSLAFDSGGDLFATNIQNPVFYLFPNAAATFSTTPVPTVVTISSFGALTGTGGIAIH